MQKYIKHNSKVKRSCGDDLHHCIKCNRTGGHISKYGINMCRHCFRDFAKNMGFKKYS